MGRNMTRKVMLMATARRYTLEQIEAARKKLRSLPMKEKEPKKTHPRPIRVTATGNGEAQAGYDTKRSGAVKVYALVAPSSGNGSDGVFILLLHSVAFVLNGASGKLPHEGRNIQRFPYGCTRSQLDGFGIASILAALPPRAFVDGDYLQYLGQAQKGFVFQI